MPERQDRPREACAGFEEDLVLHHYRELSDPGREKVEAHLVTCEACRHFLEELQRLLPQTVVDDEPPAGFWQSYKREILERLDAREETGGWRANLSSWLRSWPVPVAAAAAVLALAVTLTLTIGKRQSREALPPELKEMFAVTDNLEFFKSMDFVDSIDLLEAMEGQEGSERETPHRAL